MTRLPQKQVGEASSRLPGFSHVFAEITCWCKRTDAENACPDEQDSVSFVRVCSYPLVLSSPPLTDRID